MGKYTIYILIGNLSKEIVNFRYRDSLDFTTIKSINFSLNKTDQTILKNITLLQMQNFNHIVYNTWSNLYKLLSFMDYYKIDYRIFISHHKHNEWIYKFSLNNKLFDKISNNSRCYVKKEDETFIEYVMKSGINITDQSHHPPKEGHKLWAEYIYSLVMER